MRATLPYHFCAAFRCTEMTHPSVIFCPHHAVAFLGDPLNDAFLFSPERAVTQLPCAASPDASQETNIQPMPTPGAVAPGSQQLPSAGA